jgi:hypothetical protein
MRLFREFLGSLRIVVTFGGSVKAARHARDLIEYHKNGSSYTGATIKSEEGQTLIAVFACEKMTAQSPEYKP